MDTSGHILEIGGVLGLAALAGWVARRGGLPAVVGYLVVGLAVSPFTPGYVADREQLQTLADVGVVLLLFEVGIEIDPLRLRREHGRLLLLAPVQVATTIGCGTGVGIGAGLDGRGALLLGLAAAMSSSVVVINITRSRRRTTNPQTEEALLAWSVAQDICGVAVSMGLLATLQAGTRPAWLTLAGIVAFVVIAAAAAWLLPRILGALRNEADLFLVVSVSSGLILAGLGARVFDVPIALAAFVAGLAVGESPVASAARDRLRPFRDLFAVLFFVSIGSLIDPAAIPSALGWLGVVIGLIAVAKVGVIYPLTRLGITPGVRPWQMAMGLGQVGEFSFVLASIGVTAHVIPSEVHTALLAAVVVSIVGSTLLVRLPARA